MCVSAAEVLDAKAGGYGDLPLDQPEVVASAIRELLAALRA
jgi:hypothetical protein